jgi:nucleoside 2-deoxyribosyltransferase
MDPVAIADLAALVYACVEQGFTRNCFVIMPFDKEKDPVYEAICGVLAACGLEPFRTDRRVLTGNVIAAIRDGLRNCFLAIADTTDDRPNVMYELGMAHASDKPVILLRRATEDGALPQAPFDIQTESIIGYTDDMDDLRRRLGDVVRAVCGGAVSRDDTARRAL